MQGWIRTWQWHSAIAHRQGWRFTIPESWYVNSINSIIVWFGPHLLWNCKLALQIVSPKAIWHRWLESLIQSQCHNFHDLIESERLGSFIAHEIYLKIKKKKKKLKRRRRLVHLISNAIWRVWTLDKACPEDKAL